MKIKSCLTVFIATGLLLFLCPWRLGAFTVTVRDVVTGEEKADVSFGLVNGDSPDPYASAGVYLDVGHSAEANRSLYLFTDNRLLDSVVTGPGLLTPGIHPPLPFYFQQNNNVLSPPPLFNSSTENLWTPLLDASEPVFADDTVKNARALLLPGDEKRSIVYLGINVAPGDVGGDYRSHLVVEEFSNTNDADGPLVVHQEFHDLIYLRTVTPGFVATMTDDSSVVSATFCYRLNGHPVAPNWAMISGELKRDSGNEKRWIFTAEIDPLLITPDLLGPMDYKFIGVDADGNVGQSPEYHANMITENESADRPLSEAGGVFSVALGDPRLPGIALDLPSGGVVSAGLMQMGIDRVDTLVPLNGNYPFRLFNFSPEGVRFLTPAMVHVPYSDNNPRDNVLDGTSIPVSDLRVFWFDGYAWRLVGGVLDSVNRRIKFSTTHLGSFGLFQYAGSLTAEDVRPKERVLTPNGDNKNDEAVFSALDPLVGAFTIEIVDIRGVVVRELSNVNVWNGRNDNGEVVESGTYIYHVTGQGLTVTGMIAVAR